MASPTIERVEPHKKAHFSLHVSDQITSSDASAGAYQSIKYNHKPSQVSKSRSTTLTSLSANTYNLTLKDENISGPAEIFKFKGQKSAPKKSYVLILDPASQHATLEPLSSNYTFNLATWNGQDFSSKYTKIYPKKYKEDAQTGDEDEDLFGEAAAEDEAGDPDPDNPYDFRHFLTKEKEKRGDESEYHFASSPDYRTGTGSASNTPQFGARRPVAAPASKAKTTEPVPKRQKKAVADPMVSKRRKAQPTPAVVLQRTASEISAKPKSKAAAPPASKIKSAEIIHSSDESDVDADGEVASSPPAQAQRSPSPIHHQQTEDEFDDAEGESDDDGGLEIEIPDACPPRRGKGALAALGLGSNLGVGAFSRSPSNGPISLANSVNGSPNHRSLASRNRNTQDVIDFGDSGEEDAEGEEDDEEDYHNRDVDPINIGPPARQGTTGQDRKASTVGGAMEDDEDDLEKMMMEGLAGGDSSEESEEE